MALTNGALISVYKKLKQSPKTEAFMEDGFAFENPEI